MKKLLMLSTDNKIFESGSAVRVRQIDYAKQYQSVTIIVLNSFNAQIENINIENISIIPTNSKTLVGRVMDAIKIGRSLDFDLITSQDPFETGLAGFYIYRNKKKNNPDLKLELQIHTELFSPYFTSFRLGLRLFFLNSVRLALARFLLPKADSLRVVSNRIADSIKSRFAKFSQNPDLIEIRPIKVNTESISKAEIKNQNNLRLKYPQFSKIFLIASRLEPEKNIISVLKAWKEITKKRGDLGLIIVGSGRLETPLKQYVQKYRLDKNIIFESWQDDLISYYKSSDYFINASFYEGYGMTLVEAKASGCKVISTPVGVAEEIGAEVVELNMIKDKLKMIAYSL